MSSDGMMVVHDLRVRWTAMSVINAERNCLLTDQTTSALRQEGPQQELDLEAVIDLADRYVAVSRSHDTMTVEEQQEFFEQAARLRAALSASRTAQQQETDGEDELYTGDDERLDAVTSIVAGLEAMRDDPEANADITFDSLIDDCTALDALLLATIKRERGASRTAQEPRSQKCCKGTMAGSHEPQCPLFGARILACFCVVDINDVIVARCDRHEAQRRAVASVPSPPATWTSEQLAERVRLGLPVVLSQPAQEANDRAWHIMDRIYKKVDAMTTGSPWPTTAFYDFGVPILAAALSALPSSPAEGEKEKK